MTLREIGILGTIAGIVIGGSLSLGAQNKSIEKTEEDVKEIKVEAEKNRDIDIAQTVVLQDVSTTLKFTVKMLEKLENKMDKGG